MLVVPVVIGRCTSTADSLSSCRFVHSFSSDESENISDYIREFEKEEVGCWENSEDRNLKKEPEKKN